MSADDVFALIAVERVELADELDALTPEQWATPSLCTDWTVREVAGHLVVPFEVSVPTLMIRIARYLGNFNRAMDTFAQEQAQRPTAELVDTLRANAEHRFTPPMSGPEAPLTDIVVHGQDIRRPLGIVRALDPTAARAVLDATADGFTGFVPKSRVAGLSFAATDLDWSSGTGALVQGPAEALVLAIAGRAVALDDLTGDGVETLRARLAGA